MNKKNIGASSTGNIYSWSRYMVRHVLISMKLNQPGVLQETEQWRCAMMIAVVA